MLMCGRGGFIAYLLDREDIQGPWKQYTEHEFVQKMARGTLPIENFKYYMIQDYLFLVGLPCCISFRSAKLYILILI